MAKYNATKVLASAVPTVRLEDNLVTKWELKVVYSYNGFTRDYGDGVDVLYLAKTADQYTKSELMGMINLAQYDQIFDAHYDAYHTPPVEERQASFDITKIPD
jgi:hypothetical protein